MCLQRFPIVGLLEITVQSVKEPKRRVGGVVKPLIFAFRKKIRISPSRM